LVSKFGESNGRHKDWPRHSIKEPYPETLVWLLLNKYSLIKDKTARAVHHGITSHTGRARVREGAHISQASTCEQLQEEKRFRRIKEDYATDFKVNTIAN
jgi:hypothetical protein